MLAGVVQIEVHLSRISVSKLAHLEIFCGAANYVAFGKAGSHIRSVSGI
jgi:hypothetical protein